MAVVAPGDISEVEASAYRAEFPVFDHTTYLNSCSLGPASRRVEVALGQYQVDWSTYGAPAWWKCWMVKLDEAKARFASLIGAGVHEVTVSHSISSALSSIASTFDYSARSAVVCSDLDFPTISYQWMAKKRDGVHVRFARSPDRIHTSFDQYAALVDRDVACVATSHSFFTTGYIQPIRKLADWAHSQGARLIVDGYHAVGVFPVDVKALDIDFYVGGTLKWLLGGPGLTFIYVREELIQELSPSITGWFASADQFAFDALHLDWPPTADRLELGTPAVSTAYSGVAGMDMILEAGPDRIYTRIQNLTQRVVDQALEANLEVLSPANPEERGGIVMLRVSDPAKTVELLAERGFTIDARPGLIRISPHFYNTADDVDGLMDALRQIGTG